ncbi:MAG: FHA domain-containing protein [Akkermansia sp.]|nr:FHA domain-containing protein [Akkermansia sp.]
MAEEVQESTGEGLPAIMLPPLGPQDPLRRKWQLFGEWPDMQQMSPEEIDRLQESGRRQVPTIGRLRLYGLLRDGEPWSYTADCADIAARGGLVIGRDPEQAAILLPEDSVSRTHALLEITESGPTVSDLGSTNGLSLDGRRMPPYAKRIPLQDGARLTIGGITLRVELCDIR